MIDEIKEVGRAELVAEQRQKLRCLRAQARTQARTQARKHSHPSGHELARADEETGWAGARECPRACTPPPAHARARRGLDGSGGGRDAWARVHVRERGFRGKEGGGGGRTPRPRSTRPLLQVRTSAHTRALGRGEGVIPTCNCPFVQPDSWLYTGHYSTSERNDTKLPASAFASSARNQRHHTEALHDSRRAQQPVWWDIVEKNIQTLRYIRARVCTSPKGARARMYPAQGCTHARALGAAAAAGDGGGGGRTHMYARAPRRGFGVGVGWGQARGRLLNLRRCSLR